MKAIIMAGGHGTRLRPLTSNQPKPMIRIANLPCMEHIVNLLSRHGFTDVAVTLQFMPEAIQDYFGDGSEWGVNISYSVEDAPAGTAGSVKMAEQQLGFGDEQLLIISGDALTDCDLGALVSFHEERRSEATMVLKSVENPLDFGIVITEEDGRISHFLEKPDWGEVFSDTVNTGIYLLEPSVMGDIPDPEEGEYDFAKDLFPKMLEQGRPIYGHVTEAYWEDIGTLEQYAAAQRAVLSGEVKGIRLPGRPLKDGVYVGRRARVDEEALEGPVVIGDNVRVDEGAEIGDHSVIGSNVVIGAGSRVSRSVVADGSYVGEGAELTDTLVGRSSYVQSRARLLEKSALGDEVKVGEGATVAPEVKVYPHKTIESGANVTQSLIYEPVGSRRVFERGAVSGRFNVDLTPEFFVRLASAFGTSLDPGAVVTLGRDASLAAQAAKRAMTSALLATGIHVRDLRAAHAGVVRHDVRAGKSSAGAHLRAGEAADDLQVHLFTSEATPMGDSERAEIEKVFVREEYRRAREGDLGQLIFPGRALEQYTERLARAADLEKTAGTTIVVDFSGGVAGLVASRVFSRLGIQAVVLEGFANAPGADLAARGDPGESVERVARIVPGVGAAFGCVIGPTGEDVQFLDDRGNFVPPEVMLACFLEGMQPAKAVLPVNLSASYRRLVEGGGGSVKESRAGLTDAALAAAESGADIAGTADGYYVFPSFLPAPDCFITLAQAAELFRDEPLSGVRSSYGEGFGNVAQVGLYCPWSAKGRVMRGLAERFGGDPDAMLADGVKVDLDGGWVLMMPDPEDPVFHVYAEPEGSGGDPQKLMREYVDLVRALIEERSA